MRSMTRLLACATAAAALALSGCSAGQNAQTAQMTAAVPGANLTIPVRNSGSLSVGNALVAFKGAKGYKAGQDAPLDLRIFNETATAVTVTISSPEAAGVVLVNRAAVSPSATVSPSAKPSGTPSVTASGKPGSTASVTPSASPSVSATPAADGAPAKMTIPAGGFVILAESADQYIKLVKLKDPLPNGESVAVTFVFTAGSEKIERTIMVPVAPPITPGPQVGPEEPKGEGH